MELLPFVLQEGWREIWGAPPADDVPLWAVPTQGTPGARRGSLGRSSNTAPRLPRRLFSEKDFVSVREAPPAFRAQHPQPQSRVQGVSCAPKAGLGLMSPALPKKSVIHMLVPVYPPAC